MKTQNCIIFWDYESSRIPSRQSPFLVASKIREELRMKGEREGDDEAIFSLTRSLSRAGYQAQSKLVFTDVFREDRSLLDDLSKCGFDVVLCRHPKCKPEEVDKRMINTLMRFNHTAQREVPFVVVTKDADFCNTMNTMRDLGRTVVFLKLSRDESIELAYAADVTIQVKTAVEEETARTVEEKAEEPDEKPARDPSGANFKTFPKPSVEARLSEYADALKSSVKAANKNADGSILVSELAELFYNFSGYRNARKKERTRFFWHVLEHVMAEEGYAREGEYAISLKGREAKRRAESLIVI